MRADSTSTEGVRLFARREVATYFACCYANRPCIFSEERFEKLQRQQADPVLCYVHNMSVRIRIVAETRVKARKILQAREQ